MNPKPFRYLLALVVLLLAPLAHAGGIPSELDIPPPTLELYAGRLVTLQADGTGAIARDQDMYVVRAVVAVPGPFGLRVGFRGDLTSLAYIDPASLDPSSVRTAEGYTALSWSTKVAGVSFGPAVFGGALVPVQDAVEWRMKGAYGGGLRVGAGASWIYAFVGKDKASDEIGGSSPMRVIVPFQVQVPIWRTGFGVQGEVVTGAGGRWRLAVVAKIPNPWSGQ